MPVTPTYVPLATVTLASTDSSITFSSIPATYRDLIVVIGGNADASRLAQLRFNGDSGSNYSYVRATGPVFSDSGTNTSTYRLARIGASQSTIVIQIMDYSATDKHKSLLGRSMESSSAVEMAAARWANTAAINSINFGLNAGSYQVGTRISIYGIA